ncbi:MAG: CDGSH iron-sulfur domain-containing protein [Bacteroidales bacterium]|nr:CDGSH iron-sulfur domain-containing protein [Bacteroidales bacterium]
MKTTASDASKADEKKETFYIKITADGPYLVYGKPTLDQQIIAPNDEGSSWVYKQGKSYEVKEPCALCRCGESKNKPYCDGAHHNAQWDPKETASRLPILEDADVYEGSKYDLFDNESYCAFARFCDAYGQIWNLIRKDGTREGEELVKHEASHCPAGRLMLRNKTTGEFFEPGFEPGISLIEDPGIKVSGPIWVRGGIRIESADGTSYEIRNRVTLCRCGQSTNKPFCDGTHASMAFRDQLPVEYTGGEW